VTPDAATGPRILIAGGGTGGHVFPALAIKQALVQLSPHARVVFAGTRNGLEAALLPRQGETLNTIWIAGFSRRHLLRNVALPVKLLVSFCQSLKLISSFKPQVVIGTGGYVMGPVLWTAQKMGIPTLLQEQNSYPGYTTKRLAPNATVVCAGFEDARSRLDAKRIEFTGNPLRSSFRTSDRTAARAQWNLDSRRKTLLIFGGSAGARSINEAVAAAIPELTKSFNLIWQTGKAGVPSTADASTINLAKESHHLQILEFIDDMSGAYAASDLAICRSGAMTLAELAMTGTPAILIPYPFATDDHQTANAQAVVSKGAGMLVKDSDLNSSTLVNSVARCLGSESELQKMAAFMKSLARPDAATRVAEIALSILRPS
jgi:UDP-N-acetylglucosamine--N-acetylmuramyl-(pentapeptide) pyrophosphoryl-undecaprenol N-acetylglucosamine transferase